MVKWFVIAALVAVGCKKHAATKPPADARPIDARAADAAEVDAPPPKPPVPTRVVSGAHTSCAIMSDKTLRCWGQLAGNGSPKDALAPVAPRLTGVADVVFGTAHACARMDDGSVACWGDIGVGKKAPTLEPMGIPGVKGAKAVFAVGGAGCATVADDSMICWGDVDARGHVRSGGRHETRVPTPVVGLTHVTQLTAHGALRDDGGVYYWTSDGVPKKTTLENATEIASTDDTLCALSKGQVECVGGTPRCTVKKPPPPTPAKKPAGQKGQKKKGKQVAKKPPPPPPAPEPALPVDVWKLPPAKHLAFDAGPCVITTARTLQCLAKDACKLEPPWFGKVDEVSGHCARIGEGAVKCWTPEGPRARATVSIGGIAGATQIASGEGHACALVGEAVMCWGGNAHGELGRGDTAAHTDAGDVELH